MDKLTIGKYTFEHWDAGDHKTWLISTPGGGVMSNEAEYLSVLIAEVRRRAAPGVVEALAAYAHETWAGWMRLQDYIGHSEFWRSFPAETTLRWKRQMMTTYENLPEAEKLSDRAEAHKILAALREGGAK